MGNLSMQANAHVGAVPLDPYARSSMNSMGQVPQMGYQPQKSQQRPPQESGQKIVDPWEGLVNLNGLQSSSNSQASNSMRGSDQFNISKSMGYGMAGPQQQ